MKFQSGVLIVQNITADVINVDNITSEQRDAIPAGELEVGDTVVINSKFYTWDGDEWI